jgi:hypothetical protein
LTESSVRRGQMTESNQVGASRLTISAYRRPELVYLLGGLTVPLTALQVLLGLEARGISLVTDADGLKASPGSKLDDADRTAIRAWRRHIIRFGGLLRPGAHAMSPSGRREINAYVSAR